jgi:hypothetical protein
LLSTFSGDTVNNQNARLRLKEIYPNCPPLSKPGCTNYLQETGLETTLKKLFCAFSQTIILTMEKLSIFGASKPKWQS